MTPRTAPLSTQVADWRQEQTAHQVKYAQRLGALQAALTEMHAQLAAQQAWSAQIATMFPLGAPR
jgi:hypothetical protein